MLTSGDVLGGRYRLDERVAAGGMGEVWLATDTVLGRGVAVKMLHAGRAADPQFRTRFLHEARAMAALRHPGVADVYDFGEAGEGAYLVMAYVRGQPLGERITAAGRLGPAETMSIVAQAARALSAAHAAGIIHRDVKPGNLMVEPDGTVVLVDFGIARSASSTTLTGVDEVIGTALYLAPEQASKKALGPAADIYALGAVAYHCLAGEPPFPGDNPVAVALRHLDDDPPPLPMDVPAPVRDLVSTAMAKEPADRFPDAAAMADAATAAERAIATGSVAAAAATGGAATATGGAATVRLPGPGLSDTSAMPAADRPGGPGRRAVLTWAGVLVALAALGLALALNLPTGDGSPPGGEPAPLGTTAPGSPGIGQGGEANTRATSTSTRSRRPAPTTGSAAPGPGATEEPGPAPTSEAPLPEPTVDPTEPADPDPTVTVGGGDGGGDQAAPVPPTR